MNGNSSGRRDSLLPNEGTGLSVTQLQGMQQQNLRNAVKAAHCMRAHGIEDFPDPDGSTQDSGVNWAPVQSAIQRGRVNTSTPSYEAAYDACSGKRVGGPIPLTSRRGSWRRHPAQGPAEGPGPGDPAPVRRGRATRVALWSGYDDHLDADGVVGAAGPRVPGCQGRAVFLGGQGDERVVHGPAGDAEACQRVWQLAGAGPAQHQRGGKPGGQQPGGVGGPEPGVAGQPGENGVGFGQSVTGEGHVLPVPPPHHGRVIVM